MKDFVEEVVDERARRNPGFRRLVAAAQAARAGDPLRVLALALLPYLRELFEAEREASRLGELRRTRCRSAVVDPLVAECEARIAEVLARDKTRNSKPLRRRKK